MNILNASNLYAIIVFLVLLIGYLFFIKSKLEREHEVRGIGSLNFYLGSKFLMKLIKSSKNFLYDIDSAAGKNNKDVYKSIIEDIKDYFNIFGMMLITYKPDQSNNENERSLNNQGFDFKYSTLAHSLPDYCFPDHELKNSIKKLIDENNDIILGNLESQDKAMFRINTDQKEFHLYILRNFVLKVRGENNLLIFVSDTNLYGNSFIEKYQLEVLDCSAAFVLPELVKGSV